MDTSNSIFTVANSAPSIDVVEKVCGLTTKGGWFSSPFRKDENPSCKCSNDMRFTTRITDFGTKEKFTNVNFVCKFFNIDLQHQAAEAAKMILEKLGDIPSSAPTPTPAPTPAADSNLKEAAKKSWYHRGDYAPILARGISEDVIKEMKLWYDKKANAIVIPTYNGSGLSGLIYRNLDSTKPKYQNSTGFKAAEYVYGIDHIKLNRNYLYVVEGWFDYLACRTAGIDNVVALHTCTMTNGNKKRNCQNSQKETEPDNSQARQLSAYRLVLALDADESGQKNQQLLLSMPNVVGYIKYPKGCKDANDVLLQKGSKGLLKCFKKIKKVKLPKHFINK